METRFAACLKGALRLTLTAMAPCRPPQLHSGSLQALWLRRPGSPLSFPLPPYLMAPSASSVLYRQEGSTFPRNTSSPPPFSISATLHPHPAP